MGLVTDPGARLINESQKLVGGPFLKKPNNAGESTRPPPLSPPPPPPPPSSAGNRYLRGPRSGDSESWFPQPDGLLAVRRAGWGSSDLSTRNLGVLGGFVIEVQRVQGQGKGTLSSFFGGAKMSGGGEEGEGRLYRDGIMS